MTEIIFRVFGIPREQPKLVNTGPGTPRPRDKKIRARDQNTGRLIKKAGGGYLMEGHPRQNWKDNVCRAAINYMDGADLDPFPAGTPLIMSLLFYLPPPAKMPKGRRFPMGSDLDNYKYVIYNALKGTTKKTKARPRWIGPEGNSIETYPGIWPEGICFKDDDQIVLEMYCAKLYSTENCPPGVVIYIGNLTEPGDRKLNPRGVEFGTALEDFWNLAFARSDGPTWRSGDLASADRR